MNDYITKSGSIQSVPTILCECRKLMTEFLKQSLPNMMDEVDDVLLDIAVRTINSQERTKYINAMHEVRLKRHNIEEKCIQNFGELFSENLGSRDREINMMEEADDVDSMAMGNIANKARNDCYQTLLKMDKQMNNILKNYDIESKVNPVSPEIVCKAFYNACELIDSGTGIRLIIFKYFEKSILPLLNDVYLEIDHILDIGSSSKESEQISIEESRNEGYQSIADNKLKVISELQDLLTGKYVPDFISDFLFKHWVKLLAKIYDKNGINSSSWRHAIETVEDLIWSVGSISSQEDRDRFDKLWPDINIRLRNGINMISMSSHEEADFISSLSKHRATLTMLVALSKTNNNANLINPEKIKEMKMKIKSCITPADLDSTGSEDITIPMPKTSRSTRPFMDELLVDNFDIEGFKSDITGD